MAAKTWNGNITPRTGENVEWYLVSAMWLGANSSIPEQYHGVLATTLPDSAGDFSLTFDDQDIPGNAVRVLVGGDLVPALYLFVWGDLDDTHIFGPYNPDGDVMTI